MRMVHRLNYHRISNDSSLTMTLVLLIALNLFILKLVKIEGFQPSSYQNQQQQQLLPLASSLRNLQRPQPLKSHRSTPVTSSNAEAANDRRQESLQQGNNPLISLNMNLDALARSKNAAPRAQELLERIHALYEEGYYEVSPNVVSYNSVLKAWKEGDNPQKAYELLQDMIETQQQQQQQQTRQDSSNDDDDYDYDYTTRNGGIGYFDKQQQPQPPIDYVDVISFNTVILAFARQGDYPQAEKLLREMQTRHDYPNPDAITYNSVLYAFAQSNEDGTAIRAENLLKEMMRVPQEKEEEEVELVVGHPHNVVPVVVDTTTFNTVIHAWARMVSNDNPSAANRAQRLLDHMEQLNLAGNVNVKPNVYSYTTVIQAWARCGEATKAQRVLERMTSIQNLAPNRYTYTAVMSSLAKSGKPRQAEQLLMEMMDAYKYDGSYDLKPDTVAFSSVIDGYAKISNVDKPHAADNALRLLEQMKQLSHDGMGPNSRTYTSVLTAIAKSGTWDACDKARDLLIEMEDEFQNSRNPPQLKPTTIHYNTVLLAYARSPRADKALKANGFLQKMMLQNPNPRCQPDTISYNTLLMSSANAFGNEELKSKSFKVAVWALKQVCTSPVIDKASSNNNKIIIRPTSSTFSHFCKSARRLLDEKQSKIVLQKTLKLCCEKGLLNPVIVQQIRSSCNSLEDWKHVAGPLSDYVDYKDSRFKKGQIPQSWTCNARR